VLSRLSRAMRQLHDELRPWVEMDTPVEMEEMAR
jgi:hypothetical protein